MDSGSIAKTHSSDELAFRTFLITMAGVGSFIAGVFFWLCVRFRKRDGVPSQYIRGELKSEKRWITLELPRFRGYPHTWGRGVRDPEAAAVR